MLTKTWMCLYNLYNIHYKFNDDTFNNALDGQYCVHLGLFNYKYSSLPEGTHWGLCFILPVEMRFCNIEEVVSVYTHAMQKDYYVMLYVIVQGTCLILMTMMGNRVVSIFRGLPQITHLHRLIAEFPHNAANNVRSLTI